VSERDPNELGALWEKQGARGTYFTGKIGDQPVVVFKNDKKEAGSKAPDWRVLKPQKKEQAAVNVGASMNEPITDQDVPF